MLAITYFVNIILRGAFRPVHIYFTHTDTHARTYRTETLEIELGTGSTEQTGQRSSASPYTEINLSLITCRPPHAATTAPGTLQTQQRKTAPVKRSLKHVGTNTKHIFTSLFCHYLH